MDNKIISNLLDMSDNMHLYDYISAELFGTRIQKTDVSIMIPTYKRQNFLVKAIASALGQKTTVNYEVVVIDNDPETDTLIINNLLNKMHDERLSYYRNEKNIGMFGNWNRCISYSHGKWIILLHDDDELKDDYIEIMIRCVRSQRDCGALACQHVLVDKDDEIIGDDIIRNFKNNVQLIPIRMKDYYFFHPTNIYGCLFNRDIALKVGGFDERLYPCSDAGFLIKICQISKIYLCTQQLIKYRWAVNESLKNETQIDFVEFTLLKACQINKEFLYFKTRIDTLLRSCFCDKLIFTLVIKDIMDKKDMLSFRNRMGFSSSYSGFRRFIGRAVGRIYLEYFKARKRINI